MSDPRIYKYPLQVGDSQKLRIPEVRQLLTVQVQHGTPCLWALVDPDRGEELWEVRIYGTGHPCDAVIGTWDGAHYYCGTFQLHGDLVFHVFARRLEHAPEGAGP